MASNVYREVRSYTFTLHVHVHAYVRIGLVSVLAHLCDGYVNWNVRTMYERVCGLYVFVCTCTVDVGVMRGNRKGKD